jgi:probable addiction module antidote protein
MNVTRPVRSTSHDSQMRARLERDPEFAAEYLRAAMADTDEPRVLLLALRRLTEARGGITLVARQAGIERESLHRALSARGNPRFSTLAAVAKALGLRLTVEAA